MSRTHVSFPDEHVAAARCPNCLGRGLRRFYHVAGVPSHSCLLMHTRDAARDFPRGDLDLALCQRCGFITNRALDPRLQAYSTEYEETQEFSPTFRGYAAELAERIVERYALQDKTVLEIGCGKAAFLAMLCRDGRNRGIGIDPAAVPERMPPELARPLTFRQELYSPAHAGFAADLVCCRHTLEHIAEPRPFVELLRANLGDRPADVFFDIPDVLRVLQEGAFWDLYYEHCSYFSTASLVYLFQAAGFDVIETQLEYDDQYLLLFARPGGVPTNAPRVDSAAILAAVDHFCAQVRGELERWGALLAEVRRDGGRAVIWGAGSKGVAFLTTLGLADEVAAAVDINPHKRGTFMPGTGHPIVGPDDLPELGPTHVIVMNPVYCDEIARDLAARGLEPRMYAVGLADQPSGSAR